MAESRVVETHPLSGTISLAKNYNTLIILLSEMVLPVMVAMTLYGS